MSAGSEQRERTHVIGAVRLLLRSRMSPEYQPEAQEVAQRPTAGDRQGEKYWNYHNPTRQRGILWHAAETPQVIPSLMFRIGITGSAQLQNWHFGLVFHLRGSGTVFPSCQAHAVKGSHPRVIPCPHDPGLFARSEQRERSHVIGAVRLTGSRGHTPCDFIDTFQRDATQFLNQVGWHCGCWHQNDDVSQRTEDHSTSPSCQGHCVTHSHLSRE
jgi:hypothetical protein